VPLQRERNPGRSIAFSVESQSGDPVDIGSPHENVSEWQSGPRNSAGNAIVNGETTRPWRL